MSTINTVRCDKCGRVEDEPRTMQWGYIYRYPNGYKDGVKVDFCPECYTLLDEFIFQRPGNLNGVCNDPTVPYDKW